MQKNLILGWNFQGQYVEASVSPLCGLDDDWGSNWKLISRRYYETVYWCCMSSNCT